MTTINDRRSSVSRVKISDGNGGELELYNFSIMKWKTWLAAIAALLAIGGVVFGAAAAGVRLGTRDEIQFQISQPLSPLNLHIGTLVEHAMDVREQYETPLHRQQNAEIAALKEGQAERRTQILDMQQDLAEMRVDIKELLRRVR
jgi:hypothetical protein